MIPFACELIRQCIRFPGSRKSDNQKSKLYKIYNKNNMLYLLFTPDSNQDCTKTGMFKPSETKKGNRRCPFCWRCCGAGLKLFPPAIALPGVGDLARRGFRPQRRRLDTHRLAAQAFDVGGTIRCAPLVPGLDCPFRHTFHRVEPLDRDLGSSGELVFKRARCVLALPCLRQLNDFTGATMK